MGRLLTFARTSLKTLKFVSSVKGRDFSCPPYAGGGRPETVIATLGTTFSFMQSHVFGLRIKSTQLHFIGMREDRLACNSAVLQREIGMLLVIHY